MKKILYALCLTVLLGVIAAWVWSYQCQYRASVWFPSGTRVMMLMGCGQIQIAWGRSDLPAPPRIEFKHAKAAPAATGLGVTSFWTWLGFYRYIDSRTGTIVVPHWLFVAMPTAILTLVATAGPIRRRRRRRRGLCPRCGYDLRGLAGRCPECGEAAGSVGSPAKPEPGGRA